MKSFLKIIGSIILVYIIIFSCNKIISNNLKNSINKDLKGINTKNFVNQSVEIKNKTLDCSALYITINHGRDLEISTVGAALSLTGFPV